MAKIDTGITSFEHRSAELTQRFDGLGLSENDFGEKYINARFNVIMHVLIEKKLVTLEELVGVVDEKTGAMKGGIIESVVHDMKRIASLAK